MPAESTFRSKPRRVNGRGAKLRGALPRVSGLATAPSALMERQEALGWAGHASLASQLREHAQLPRTQRDEKARAETLRQRQPEIAAMTLSEIASDAPQFADGLRKAYPALLVIPQTEVDLDAPGLTKATAK